MPKAGPASKSAPATCPSGSVKFRNLWGWRHHSGHPSGICPPSQGFFFSLFPAAASLVASCEHCLVCPMHLWEGFDSAFTSLKKKQVVQNTCWYRDLDKSHKTNGKNWSTSYFLTQTELRRGNSVVTITKPACAAVLVSNNRNLSGRRWGEVGRGGERNVFTVPHVPLKSASKGYKSSYLKKNFSLSLDESLKISPELKCKNQVSISPSIELAITSTASIPWNQCNTLSIHQSCCPHL